MITMTDGVTMLIDDADIHLLAGHKPYLGSNGYAYVSFWDGVRSRPETVHSLIVGNKPGMHIDHRNGNRLDNRRANLRVVTPQRNQANRANGNRNNTSGHRGVVRYEGPRGTRWRARIMVNGKSVHLGSFLTAAEAVAARRSAERENFGEECPR